jgi:hypothetical protein
MFSGKVPCLIFGKIQPLYLPAYMHVALQIAMGLSPLKNNAFSIFTSIFQ